MTEAPEKYVGGGVPRKEDPALVTGRANWTDNIKLPGMLHVTLLRSPYAHAKITSIDVSAAKEQPGVFAVFTGDDLAEDWDKNPQANPAAITGYAMSLSERSQGGASVTESGDGQDVDEDTRTFCAWIPTDDTKIPNHWPVARDEVNYAGDVVAVVVATDRYKAQDALEFIEVDYEPLEPMLDVDAAYSGDGPLVHEDLGTNQSFTWDLDVGEDIGEAFDKADVVVKERYVQQRLIPNAIETRGVVANP
ncbi:MAG: xanthine dehydrogenase family protein molybdopterin-binding subunit, partial [Rubrobacter sp.]